MSLLSYDEALRWVHEIGAAHRLASERVPLSGALGRITAADAVATVDHPPFDNSAMDGFALIAEDATTPLEIIERIAAGPASRRAPLERGQCHAIMTGAPLPAGADAVVPVESTRVEGGKLCINGAVAKGDYLRRRGADYRAGDTVLTRGARIGPDQVLALATVGVVELEVVRAPRIALVSTGAELVGPGPSLAEGQIYDANGPFLAARVAELGAVTTRVRSVGEDVRAFEAVLREEADLVISTGAVSMGDHDFVPDVLRAIGARIVFHKVAIRPGKPILFAELPSGALFLGLPGNPASAAVGFQFFARPLLRAMEGRLPEAPRRAVLRTAYDKGSVPLRFFLRAHLSVSESGMYEAEVVRKQPSFMVSPFVTTDGWVEISEHATELPAGTVVPVHVSAR